MQNNKIILTLDSHQLSDFQTCEQLFKLRHLENLALRGEENHAMSLGSTIHLILQQYYRGKKDKEVINQIIRKCFQLIQCFGNGDLKSLDEFQFNKKHKDEIIKYILKEEEKDLLRQKISEYAGKYQSDTWQPLDFEVGFSKKLYEDCNVMFIYEGVIDMPILISNRKLFVDHKSQNRAYDLRLDSNQMLGYAWAFECTLGIINFFGLQKSMKPEDCFRRETLSFSHGQILKWQETTIQWYFRILQARLTKTWLENHSAFAFGKKCPYESICKETSVELINQIKEQKYIKIEPWKPW